jgi:hypothetical protein
MLANILGLMKFKLAAVAVAVVVAGAGGVALVAAGTASHGNPPSPLLKVASASTAKTASPAPQAQQATPAIPSSSVPPASATTGAAVARAAVPGAGVPAAGRAPAAKTAPKAPSTAPAIIAVPAPAAAVSCPTNEKLTDGEINWLIKEVSKTAAAQPNLASGAATINAALTPLLGQNLCASQAQPTVTALCNNPVASQTISQMVGQLPLYVQLVIGNPNPCTQSLASILPKLSPFTSTLS